MKVYIGYDQREQLAYDVAVHSLHAHRWDCEVIPLKAERLYDYGLLRRPTDRRGQLYDIPSGANASTDFAISRFLVPHLCQEGWALFVDCDVVFMDDVAKLFDLADPSKAVQVVQHAPLQGTGVKMDGQSQSVYGRKNWSSVMLFNCDHPANRRLSLQDVNERPGRDLHRFYWLADHEIGELPASWNWLVNVQDKPESPAIAHFTLGTPNLTDALRDTEHSDIWWNAYRRMCGRQD